MQNSENDSAPCLRGQDIGYGTIEATVTNADFSFDSPAIYKIDHPEINYVLSYTLRFRVL